MTTRVAADIDDRKVFRRLPAVETIYAIKYRKWNFFFVLYYVLFPVNKYVCMYVCKILTFSILPVCCALNKVLTRVTFKTLAGRRFPTLGLNKLKKHGSQNRFFPNGAWHSAPFEQNQFCPTYFALVFWSDLDTSDRLWSK